MSDPISSVIDAVGTVVDKIFPDADAAQKRELAMTLAQIEVNKAEAQNTNWFVAGWRPFIGWVCGGALAWQYVAGPLVNYLLAVLNHPTPLPVFDTVPLITLLGGMLGLGGLRTFEKLTGTEKNR